MPSLERFERLINSAIDVRPTDLRHIGNQGEHTTKWLDILMRLPREEQVNQVKAVLTELLISDISDERRLTILDEIGTTIERMVIQLQADYVKNPQNSRSEQEACIDDVRSLYFLQILCHQGIANRSYGELTDSEPASTKTQTQAQTGWFSNLTKKFTSNTQATPSPITPIVSLSPSKRLLTLAVYRMMSIYYKLINEFALTYQRVPAVIWGQMNAWYLKTATQGLDKHDVNKLNHTIANNTIHQQYMQCCLASFANLFAYRRTDITNIFKILPNWAVFLQASFTAHSHYKVFINLQAPTPPEFITPYATINPYSNEQICLFVDVKPLFDHLKSMENDESESRMAKIVSLAFSRQLENSTSNTRINEHLADMMTGFFPIFDKLSGGKSFASLINQSALPEPQHPRITHRSMVGTDEVVKVLTKSDASVQFVFGDFNFQRPVDTDHLNLSVFGLFALKSHHSTDKNPWRLGMIHWAEPKENQIAVDGKFFGRILSVCGIRLRANAGDHRPQDFIQAILVSGDGIHNQPSLVMPRYHFKENDTVILRVENKESTLRLQRKLLIADDFEQYEIVRLV